MANYLQANTATGVSIIASGTLPDGADILDPQDFLADLATLPDNQTIYTYVYEHEQAQIEQQYSITCQLDKENKDHIVSTLVNDAYDTCMQDEAYLRAVLEFYFTRYDEKSLLSLYNLTMVERS